MGRVARALARAGWGNLSLLQRRADQIHHAIQILANIAVRDAQNPEAFPPQNGVADGLVRLGVAIAIDFDDEA